jgi:Holliday junction resolvase RusA-like endonuclease
LNILKIIIPGQPKGKTAARAFYNKKKEKLQFYNPSSVKMDIIKRIVKEQLPEDFVMPLAGVPVWCSCLCFFEPNKTEQKNKKFMKSIENEDIPYIRKPDRDNITKLMDSLSKILYYDDNQIYDGPIGKYYSTNPRIEIELKY